MTISRDSLSGQNSQGRLSGARSSRALSTIFKKLRKLDREIGAIDRQCPKWLRQFDPKVISRREKLDQKRIEIRLKRKEYTP
jgi:hypothetical protein